MKNLLFSLLALLCAAASSAQTNNIGVTIPPTAFGFTVFHHTPVSLLPHSIVRSWDSNHVSWFTLNPSRGVYDWTNLDAFTTNHAGNDLIYTFGLTPGWAASHPEWGTPYKYGSSCSMPSNLNDWDAFVTAIATHTGEKIRFWELWNEPMNYQYWCGKDFATFATMARHARTIIKHIIPDAVILSPSTDKPFGQAWLKYFLAAGGANTFDIMAIHGYPDNDPEGIVPMLAQYSSLMAANGMGGMPIWDTETASGDPTAARLAKLYLLEWSSGITRTIWYGYDIGKPLWTPTTGLTELGTGYVNLYSWMVGAKLTAACAKDDAGTYTCPITRPKYRGLIVWNSTKTVSMAAPTGMTQYRDLIGGMQRITGGAVSVGNSPILLQTTSNAKMLSSIDAGASK